MKESVCLLLPVHDAESWLAREVSRILELLCEFESRCELVIIDDGSLDETAGEAQTLAAKYPQVRVRRQPLRYGPFAAVQTGLQATSCRLVLLAEDTRAVTFRNLSSLLSGGHVTARNFPGTAAQGQFPRVSCVRRAGRLRLLVREIASRKRNDPPHSVADNGRIPWAVDSRHVAKWPEPITASC